MFDGFGYDPEATIQDADIEMMDLANAGIRCDDCDAEGASEYGNSYYCADCAPEGSDYADRMAERRSMGLTNF